MKISGKRKGMWLLACMAGSAVVSPAFSAITTPTGSINATGSNQGFTIGSATATSDTCIAIGGTGSFNATAQCGAEDATALGNGAVATGQSSNAFGTSSTASGNFAIAMGDGSNASGAESLALGRNAKATNPNSVAIGSGATTSAAVTTSNVAINGTTYNFAGGTPVGVFSIGTTGSTRQVTNMAAGRLSATSTDGVNGSQLYATNQAVGALGGRVSIVEDTITNINNGGGVKYFHTNSTKADSQASGPDSTAIGPGAVASGNGSIAMGNGAQAQADGSVALGAGASDGNRGAESYTGKYSGATNNSVGTVSVGNAATGELRTISNVADGVQGTDAVNLRQLDGAVEESKKYTDDSIGKVNEGIVNIDKRVSTAETNISSLQQGTSGMFQVRNTNNQPAPSVTGENSIAGGAGARASGSNSAALGNGAVASNNNAVALGANSVTDRDNSVSVGSKGNERQITNVAAATNGTDAVNYDQLKSSVASVGSEANAYTDKRVNQLKDDMDQQNKKLGAGIASAIAMANLPQPVDPNASMFTMGAGAYHGESGLAMGLSHRSESGRWVTKASISTNTQDDWSLGVGAGYQF